MPATDYTERQVLNWLTGSAPMATSMNRYVSLHTADTTDAGTGTEVSGNAYARANISSGANFPTLSSETNGTVVNDVEIAFPEASGSWGTVTHVAIWDASTNGNCLWYAPLSSSINPTAGVVVKFNTSTKQLTLTCT